MIEERKERTNQSNEEQINIQQIIFRYLIHWPWFVVSVIICMIGAWVYLFTTTPIYNISATVLIKDDEKGGGASMGSELEKMGLDGFMSSSKNVDNEIEVLRSKSLAREVVNQLSLYVTYRDGDAFPEKELYRNSPGTGKSDTAGSREAPQNNGSGNDFTTDRRHECADYGGG